MVAQHESVRRRVGFFRMRVSGSRKRQAPDPAFGALVVRTLRQRRKDGEAEWRPGDGTLFTAWSMTRNGTPALKLTRVRLEDLPQSYRGGDLIDLELAEDEGIADSTHVCFFGDGVIGVEYNYHGPKATHIRHYFNSVMPELTKVQVDALLRPNSAEQLKRLQARLTLVEIGISRSRLQILEEARSANGNAIQTLKANADLFEAEHLHIELRRANDGSGSGTFLGRAATRLVRRLSRDDEFRAAARVFRIEGFDPLVQGNAALDLLDEHLVTTVTVTRLNRNRVIQSESMFDEIMAARERMSAEIADASLVSMGDD